WRVWSRRQLPFRLTCLPSKLVSFSRGHLPLLLHKCNCSVPVGSGRFRVPSQDSSWVLGTSCSSSFSLRQEPGLGSSSSRNNLTALTSQTDPPLSPGYHSLCPRVAQRDAPFKENGSRSYIVAGMVSATPAELFPRHQEASDVTRIIC